MNKNAMKVLKDTVKASAAAGREIAQQIHTLKWRTADAARQYGELRKQKGTPALRAERKALRNPDTGYERSELWWKKRGQGDVTRHQGLALGFLRGTPYVAMERSVGIDGYGKPNTPSARWIHDNIVAAFEQAGEPCPVTQADVEAWLASTSAVQAAAE